MIVRENRPHISIFGVCNAGKSTLLNFLTRSDAAIVSPVAGTTTDPVRKGFEILDFAPVVFIDTAGLDDCSIVGGDRVVRSLEVLAMSDLAIIVFREWGSAENDLLNKVIGEKIPYILIQNFFEGIPLDFSLLQQPSHCARIELNLANGCDHDRDFIFDTIKRLLPAQSYTAVRMFGGRLHEGDKVILVCPIDAEAPSGRLILPQVQAMREILDARAVAIVVQPSELAVALGAVPNPTLIVVDSQVYRQVREQVSSHIEVTSFSILLAAAKGDPQQYQLGLDAVDRLREGDRVLIIENCLHQVSCDDIGRVKIPAMLQRYTGHSLRFTFLTSADSVPEDLSAYSLAVQCGGCMVTRRGVQSKIRRCVAASVPITNYGMLIRKIG